MGGNGFIIPVKVKVDEAQRVINVPRFGINHEALFEDGDRFFMLPFAPEQIAQSQIRFDLQDTGDDFPELPARRGESRLAIEYQALM